MQGTIYVYEKSSVYESKLIKILTVKNPAFLIDDVEKLTGTKLKIDGYPEMTIQYAYMYVTRKDSYNISAYYTKRRKQ